MESLSYKWLLSLCKIAATPLTIRRDLTTIKIFPMSFILKDFRITEFKVKISKKTYLFHHMIWKAKSLTWVWQNHGVLSSKNCGYLSTHSSGDPVRSTFLFSKIFWICQNLFMQVSLSQKWRGQFDILHPSNGGPGKKSAFIQGPRRKLECNQKINFILF